ncbi:hypothetical protein [Rhizobium sp. S163]|uniref:hypothetical protein n=1 Tax=Rhizobium sp. S163 TaxID=3055039 RepID=UPI0025A9E9D9|nr:hypothetical protein [Rhizobium sp. S163]MDM9644839.1 hypothetical protein [Rhizobium sp. S163]
MFRHPIRIVPALLERSSQLTPHRIRERPHFRIRSPSEEDPRIVRHLIPYGFDFFDDGRNLPQERQISRHAVQVVLRRRKVFVRVDEVLIEELEDPRRLDAAPVGDVPEIVENAVGGRPVETRTSPPPEQGGLQPSEAGGAVQTLPAGDLRRCVGGDGFDGHAVFPLSL